MSKKATKLPAKVAKYYEITLLGQPFCTYHEGCVVSAYLYDNVLYIMGKDDRKPLKPRKKRD